jgi:hypothetical protein
MFYNVRFEAYRALCHETPDTGAIMSCAAMHTVYSSVSQLPGRSPVPGPGINYTGPREVSILRWKYSEENNIRERVKKLRPRTPK